MELIYVDLFCGAGGTSAGVELANVGGEKTACVVACVNHDKNAIASHAINHPNTLHFTEDIRTLELSPLIAHVEKMKTMYPCAKLVLWASLECTNFSKAKGGQPRDADSRTLAEHLFRYINALSPDYIQIENVEEFMSWGPLDENGKPVSKKSGRDYLRWIKNIQEYGYAYDFRILNSADYGAYTSRKRFFGIFAKSSLPIVFPKPTHCKGGSEGLFAFEKWKPVREVLDFSKEGQSIFTRKKSLVEKTLQRIYAGLEKFVANGEGAFIVKYNSMNKNGKYKAPSLDNPCPVVSCQNRLGIACVDFLQGYYGNGRTHSIDSPSPTVTTKDRFAKVSCFLDMQYGNGQGMSIAAPAGTVTTSPKHNLVTCNWLLNPQFNSRGSSIEQPCFTLIARMDKAPPYLISANHGDLVTRFNSLDSPMMKKIKMFMVIHGIKDIKMRMLNVTELKMIMGFPSDYTLIGTQAEQKKYIGNAVEVNMSRALCQALSEALVYEYKVTA